MIDCKVTENFLREKARMAKECRTCNGCILSSNGDCIADSSDTVDYAIAIVQAWSDAHPRRTYLSAQLEAFPNVSLNKYGTPSFCPRELGLADKGSDCDGADCVNCWAQVIKG